MDPVIIWPDPKPCPEDVTSSGSMLGIHRFIRSRNTCFPTEACIHRLLSKTNNLCVLGQVFWTASKVYGAVIMCVCTMWNSWSFHQYWFIIWFSFIINRKPYYVSWHLPFNSGLIRTKVLPMNNNKIDFGSFCHGSFCDIKAWTRIRFSRYFLPPQSKKKP